MRIHSLCQNILQACHSAWLTCQQIILLILYLQFPKDLVYKSIIACSRLLLHLVQVFPFSDLCLLLCAGSGYQQQGAYAQAAAPYSPPIQNSSYAPNQNYGVAAGQYDPAYQQGMSSCPGSQQQQTAPQPYYGQQSSYQSQAFPGVVFSIPARRQSQFASVLHFCCVPENSCQMRDSAPEPIAYSDYCFSV